MNSTIMKKKYLKNYSGSNVSVEWGVDGQGDRLGEPAVVKRRVIEPEQIERMRGLLQGLVLCRR